MSGIKEFQIFRYLKQWLPLIICFFVAMSILSYRVIAKKQTYTAASVIEYTNEDASQGLAPDGSQIDVTEIGSSANMAKVLENLGTSYVGGYSLDTLCSGISVEPIIEEQFENIQEAVNEEGEEYTGHPTAYIVRFTMGSWGSEALARDILNELLDVYFSDYSNKHVNLEQVNNDTSNLINTDYDYLEMVERIDNQLVNTIRTLNTRYTWRWDFRSVDTGYSFADLRDQFTLIRDIDISRLYSMILGGRITKDRDLLLDKYQNRIASYGLAGQRAQENIADILDVIDAYVEKMRESGNTDIDYNYILDDVYDNEWFVRSNGNSEQTNRTVQYDALLRSWVNTSNEWDNAEIDVAYCAYIIGVYRDGQTGLADLSVTESEEEADGTEEVEDNYSEGEEFPVVIVPYDATQSSVEKVEQTIADVIERMNALYDIVTATNEEYNEYLGATNIRILSGVSTSASVNMSVYMAIIVLFFIIIGCCGAILLGRLGDILEYLFLRDSATGCRNRVSCDKYIQDNEKLILPLGMCCINIQITNQRELNDIYGRSETDRVFKEFGRILRELFEARKMGFVGYNGGGQFWVFFKLNGGENLEQELERLVITLKQGLPQIPVSYQMGAVNAGSLAVFNIRGLISNAVKSRQAYVTGMKEEFNEAEDKRKELVIDGSHQ